MNFEEEASVAINKILVVDDSPTERHFLGGILTNRGYQVIMAENGEEAIAMAKQEKPDMILMDVVMPGLNGLQVTRAITKNEETRHITVIMCTTKGQETDKIWAMRQGARDYVTKPVTQDVLLKKIAALG